MMTDEEFQQMWDEAEEVEIQVRPEARSLTATEIAVEWMDGGYEPEFTCSDGTFVYRYVVIDLDYHMSYLLYLDHESWLCVFQKHGHVQGQTNGLTVEWLHPIDDDASPMEQIWDQMGRHVEWTRQVEIGKV
jgi:hypothetical protein